MPLHPAAKRLAPAMGIAAAFVVAFTLLNPLSAEVNPDALGEHTGGSTTVFATGKNSFSFPFANLEETERTRFAIGNSFFKRNWVEAPASTAARDGLGPHFIARSCAGCHVMDGRGAPPEWRRTLGPQPDPAVALLLRLSIPGTPAIHDGVVPEPIYGDQFNNAAIQGVKPEGVVRIHSKLVNGHFADGSRYTLRQPVYSFSGLGYGDMSQEVMISPRIAPHMAGLGLLEAIPESEILDNARKQSAAVGSVKGQVNRVWDAFAQKQVIGRFGWKANTGSLAHQSAGAFLGDIGITSSVFGREACTDVQKDCLEAPHGGGKSAGNDGVIRSSNASAQMPEIDDETLSHVIFYTATLAPAARRQPNNPQVLRGQTLFAQAQCISCHRSSYLTSDTLFPRLTSAKIAGQRIWPYTDLLLHDMGKGLADGRPDFLANGKQWKTPPLWGIGLFKDVNGHQRLLHDGRANGVMEAILWHDGEAKLAKDAVLKLSRQDRSALVAFVNSL